MTNPNDPAYPTSDTVYPSGQIQIGPPGLTKRERFAMAALQGLCANPDMTVWKVEQVARRAVEQANAAIDELNRDEFARVQREKMQAEEASTQVLEPDGGNVYRPHKVMVTSGQFWRCAHRLTGIGGKGQWIGCADCAKGDPEAYARFCGEESDGVLNSGGRP